MTTNKFLHTALYLGWLFPCAAMAQAITSPQPTLTFNHRAENSPRSTDVAVDGRVQRLASQHAPDFSLLLQSEQGLTEVNLGPYVPKDIRQGLTNGQTVRVTGIPQTFGGQSYLLARQVILSGRQLTIRNEYGFLVRTRPETASPHRGESESNGGNQ
jgi:hypothetical protein